MGKKTVTKKGQKGFTALELIVVLIVGLGIITLAASKMDMMFGGSNLSEEIDNVNTLMSNTKSLKTSSGYGAATTNLVPALINSDGIPKNISVVSNVPYNVWGGAIAIVSTGTGFTISYAGVPQEACIKMATKSNRSGAFSQVKVGAAAAVTNEYTTAQATTDCSGTTNTIVWTSVS